MIISTGRGYVFVHIPKTGGTSLALALEARAMKDDILIGDTPKARRRKRRLAGLSARGRLWKHATLTDIDGLVDADTLSGLFAFTLVRNPWDRVVSYYHWLQTQTFSHPAVALSKQFAFADFVQNPTVRRSFEQSPACSYMRRADGQEQTALYIRIEAFDADAAPLIEHLGFGLPLPHVNASARRADYRTYYTDAAAEAVAQACATDIAQFDYRFD